MGVGAYGIGDVREEVGVVGRLYKNLNKNTNNNKQKSGNDCQDEIK